MKPAAYAVVGGRLVLPGAVLASGSVLVRDGLIESILPTGTKVPSDIPHVEARGRLVTPGLIELHIHGAGGIGFDAFEDPAEGPSKILDLRAFLRRHGVSSFVPTLAAAPGVRDALVRALEGAGLPRSEIPGIYLEGPFVNPKRRGGLPPETLKSPDPAELEGVLAATKGWLRLMTIAPELPGAKKLIDRLPREGVIPCLGHSDCDLDSVELPEPPFSITHLFNAMSPFSHKQAGLAMLPFVDERPFVELNADGVHVGTTALRAAQRALNPERLILISDAVAPAGLPYGPSSYHGRAVVSGASGVRYTENGTLIGSNHLADEVLRHWIESTEAPLPEAFRALTLNPARLLGISDRRGSLEVGKEAAILLWEDGLSRPRFVEDFFEEAGEAFSYCGSIFEKAT